MSRANDFSGEIAQFDLPAVDGYVAPYAAPLTLMFDFTASVTIRASASVFIGLHKEYYLFLAIKDNLLVAGNL